MCVCVYTRTHQHKALLFVLCIITLLVTRVFLPSAELCWRGPLLCKMHMTMFIFPAHAADGVVRTVFTFTHAIG